MSEAPDQGSSPADKNGVDSDSKARPTVVSIAVTSFLSISLAAVFYFVSITATADPATRPYAAALAVAGLVVFVLLGWIDMGRAEKGIFVSTLSLLPKLHHWAAARRRNALLLCVALLICTALSVWMGPLGITSQAAACGEADEIELPAGGPAQPCKGSATRTLWLDPLQRFQQLAIVCLRSGNRWPATQSGPANWDCGERPQDPSFIRNGIDYPAHDPQTVAGQRLRGGLDRLRTALSDGRLPDRKLKDRLLFATSNLRDLGESRFGMGDRSDESYAYIAEVISHFDIVAVQELRNRDAIRKLLDLLGENYSAEFSFEAPGPTGNRERLGFIFDTRKVVFGEISTTIVFDNTGIDRSRTGQPSRPPFLAEFMVNGRRFFAMTDHAYFGQQSGERFEIRLQELKVMANGLDLMLERNFPGVPAILAGDLNVSVPDGREMEALTTNGFQTDGALGELASDAAEKRP